MRKPKERFQDSRQKRGDAPVPRTPLDALALFVASGFGSGFIPFAPGTFGSLVGCLIVYLLIALSAQKALLLQNLLILASLLIAGLGIWSASRAEKLLGRKDASQIVIDEVCGQVISFVLIAPALVNTDTALLWRLAIGFGLFRLFDIFKPYPIDELQNFQGGLGVMMDDVFAGIYAALILSLLTFIW